MHMLPTFKFKVEIRNKNFFPLKAAATNNKFFLHEMSKPKATPGGIRTIDIWAEQLCSKIAPSFVF